MNIFYLDRDPVKAAQQHYNKQHIKNFVNWLIGLPKCKKGGRCNMDNEIEYTLSSKKFFSKSNRWCCSKCYKETTNYGKY